MKKQPKVEKVEANQDLALIVKAVYKAMLKTIKEKQEKEKTNDVVEDVLDADDVSEVDPDRLPPKKDRVLYKKNNNLPAPHEKGVSKLKKMCGKHRKK